MYTPMRFNKILAIDPGFDRVGLAILDREKGNPRILFSKCIETDSKDFHGKRLQTIGEEIKKVIRKWKPGVLAIETLFFNTNITSALGVAEARGVIIYEAVNAGLVICEYSPQSIKIAVTGYGKATKDQLANMVKRLVILPTKPSRRLDDEIDAIALGITHLATEKSI